MVSNVSRDGGTLGTHVGHVGPHTLGWEKILKKKIIEQVTIQILNDNVKHSYWSTFNMYTSHYILRKDEQSTTCRKEVTVPVQCLLKLLKKMPVVPTIFLYNAPEV